MLEKLIERYFKNLCTKAGIECVKYATTHKGDPDRVCLLGFGLIVFVELKRDKNGELSKHQQHRQRSLRKKGYIVFNVASKEEARAIVDEILCKLIP